MLPHLMSKSIAGENTRLRRAPITSPAQIIRAVLVGLLLAFLFVWALPHSRTLLASHSPHIIGLHDLS